MPIKLSLPTGEAFNALILEVTEDGGLLEVDGTIRIGQTVIFEQSLGLSQAVVRHADTLDGKTVCGVAFTQKSLA